LTEGITEDILSVRNSYAWGIFKERRNMTLLVSAVVVVLVTGAAIGALLLVRRTAPDGGYFNDGDRAAGFFGVLATGFAVLLGFIVFLAFASHDESRTGAETEALLIAQQYETAQFLPTDVRAELGGQLICYGRYVVRSEWPLMEEGNLDDAINPWGIALFETLQTVEPEANSEQSAYDKWLDQTSSREEARQDRAHGAEGIIPTTLWIVLYLGAALIFVFMLFFADSGERAVVQAMMVGSVTAVMVATLLLINALDNPFHTGVGGLRPVAMERTLDVLEVQLADLGERAPLPCSENGEAL
jgi:ABC-type multidrug transport system fused ATPase/permease subunit